MATYQIKSILFVFVGLRTQSIVGPERVNISALELNAWRHSE